MDSTESSRIILKMNNTKSLMTDTERKDAIKLDTVKLDKIYPEGNALPEDGYAEIYINLENSRETKNDWPQTLYRLKIRID